MLLKSSYAVLCHAMPCHAVLCCAALQSCWQSSKHSRYYSCHSLAASASLATRLPTVAQIITPVVQHKCMAYLRRMPHKQHGAAGNVTAAVADQLVSSAYLGTQSNATPGTSAQQLAQAVTSSKLSSQDQAAAFAQAIQLAQELVMYSTFGSAVGVLMSAAESACQTS